MGKPTEADIEACQDILAHLSDMQDKLYTDEPCGGPLHIVTDDGNVRDSDLLLCYRNLCDDNYKCSRVTKAICLEILHWLSDLNEAQRLIWWHQKELSDPVAKVMAAARMAKVTHDYETGDGCGFVITVESYGKDVVLFRRLG